MPATTDATTIADAVADFIATLPGWSEPPPAPVIEPPPAYAVQPCSATRAVPITRRQTSYAVPIAALASAVGIIYAARQLGLSAKWTAGAVLWFAVSLIAFGIVRALARFPQ